MERLIRTRDEISVTIRRAVMTLDLFCDFGTETRAAMHRLVVALCELVAWDRSWDYRQAAVLFRLIWAELEDTWMEVMG